MESRTWQQLAVPAINPNNIQITRYRSVLLNDDDHPCCISIDPSPNTRHPCTVKRYGLTNARRQFYTLDSWDTGSYYEMYTRRVYRMYYDNRIRLDQMWRPYKGPEFWCPSTRAFPMPDRSERLVRMLMKSTTNFAFNDSPSYGDVLHIYARGRHWSFYPRGRYESKPLLPAPYRWSDDYKLMTYGQRYIVFLPDTNQLYYRYGSDSHQYVAVDVPPHFEVIGFGYDNEVTQCVTGWGIFLDTISHMVYVRQFTTFGDGTLINNIHWSKCPNIPVVSGCSFVQSNVLFTITNDGINHYHLEIKLGLDLNGPF